MTDDPSATTDQRDTDVDLGGLMAVLSEHLYSTSDVVVRELVQNANDSIVRRTMLQSEVPAGSIEISTHTSGEAAGARFEITDNGSGLTEDEIHRFLATVGVGATRELREALPSDQLIGMFGLGFLSVFVVADGVRVTTTSCLTPDETWEYRSADGRRYSVAPGPTRPVGTTVTLELKSTHGDLGDAWMVQTLLERYCRLLHQPIALNGSGPINIAPPWRAEHATTADLTDFAEVFESRFEPVAAVPVSGEGLLDGVLWVHGGSSYGSSDNREMSVYVRGMLLAENEIELLPRWAGFISGAIESSILTPTASRETLQRNTTFTEAQFVISEALVLGLSKLAAESPDVWRRVLDRHAEALLGAAVSDDRLFDLVAEHVRVPTSAGEATARGLRQGQRIFASLGSERGFEEILFRARGVPIARGDRYGVLAFLRKYAAKHDLELIEIGTDAGNDAVFGRAELPAADLAWLNAELASPDEEVVPSVFEPHTIPVVVIPDREAELKQRLESDDLRRASGSGMANLARLHAAGIGDRAPSRIYVNLACPTLQRILAARHSDLAGSTRAITLLRTLKTLMAATDRSRGGEADVNNAFAQTLAVIDGLLISSAEGEST